MTITAEQVEQAIENTDWCTDVGDNSRLIADAIALFRQYAAQREWVKCDATDFKPTNYQYMNRPDQRLLAFERDGQWYRFDLPEVPK